MTGTFSTRRTLWLTIIVAALFSAALWFPFQTSAIYADDAGHPRDAVIESCDVSPSIVTNTNPSNVTMTAKVRNDEAGVRVAKLYVVFDLYGPNSSKPIRLHKTSAEDVGKGNSHKFTYKHSWIFTPMAGAWTVVCGLYWDRLIGNDKLQLHTQNGGSGHPPSPILTVRTSSPAPNAAPSATRIGPRSRNVNLSTGTEQGFTARGTDPDANIDGIEWFVNDDWWSGWSMRLTGSTT